MPEALFPEIAHPKKRQLLARVAQTGRVSVRGQAQRMHYYWLRNDPAYAEAFTRARQMAGDRLEAEACRRAFEGSDTLLIFLLKGAFPEKYRERHEVYHQGAVELLHKLARLPEMSDSELDDLAREVERYANHRPPRP